MSSRSWHSSIPLFSSQQDDLKNHRQFLLDLVDKHQLQVPSSITKELIEKNGSNFLKEYRSLEEALEILFPERKEESSVQTINHPQKFTKNFFKNETHRRNQIDVILQSEGIHSVFDNRIREISMATIRRYPGGNSIMRYYKDLYDLFHSLYPEVVNWHEVFGKQLFSFPSYWNSEKNRRDFISRIASQKGLVDVHDYKKITKKDIFNAGGKLLLKEYDSVSNILASLYEEHKHLEEFKIRGKCFMEIEKRMIHQNKKAFFPWISKEEQKKILDLAKEDLGIKDIEEWNKISVDDFYRVGLKPMIIHYISIQDLFYQIYPNNSWDYINSDIIKKPNGYFEIIEHHRIFLEQIQYHLSLSTPQDLLELTRKNIIEKGGRRFLSHYTSVQDSIIKCFPELKIQFNKEKEPLPRNYWKSKKNRKLFLDKFALDNDIKTPEDWMKVKFRDIIYNGGVGLMKYYSGFSDALESIYPDINWSDYMRDRKPPGYWKSKENVINFLQTVEKQFYIREKKDWYRISQRQIFELDGGGLLSSHGGKFINVLKFAYPDEKWDKKLLRINRKRAEQRMLFISLKHLIPNTEIIEDFLHWEINRKNNVSVELDIFIPEYSLAFEYQGEHHFMDIPSMGYLEQYQCRDAEKKELCTQYGITLVEVPYWIKTNPTDLYSYFKSLDIPLLNRLLVYPKDTIIQ